MRFRHFRMTYDNTPTLTYANTISLHFSNSRRSNIWPTKKVSFWNSELSIDHIFEDISYQREILGIFHFASLFSMF